MTYDWHAPLTALKAYLPGDVEPRIDDQMQSLVLKETDEWIVSVTPMLFNDRILLTHKVRDYPLGCSAGWCYDKGGAAVLAALAWNVDTEDEPASFKKCAFDSR